jgi:hypothetical protein
MYCLTIYRIPIYHAFMITVIAHQPSASALVMAHSVVDAGLWQMPVAFPRAFMTGHPPDLMAPRGAPLPILSADRSATNRGWR